MSCSLPRPHGSNDNGAGTRYSGSIVRYLLRRAVVGLFGRKPKSESASPVPVPPVPAQPASEAEWGVTVTPNGNYSARWRSPDEARLIIKELKLRKKELQLQKRQENEREHELRAAYTERVRKQGSKVHGGGTTGRIVRSMQTASRDSARANLAKSLAPSERAKNGLQARVDAIDGLILQIEQKLLT
jgi:hypothetical protein